MDFKSIDIIFDTDCICSFLWIGEQNLIKQVFPNSVFVMVKEVYDEIYNPAYNLEIVRYNLDSMISSEMIEVLEPRLINTKEYLLYLILINKGIESGPVIGKGEASTIVEAIKRNGVVASNNLRDVKYYTDKYHLKLITTGYILEKALKDNIINLDKCEEIWQKMIRRKRKLPTDTFQEYLDLYSFNE